MGKVTHVCNKEADIATILATLKVIEPLFTESRQVATENQLRLTGMSADIKAYHEIQMTELKELKSHVQLTNGRVTTLEDHSAKVDLKIENFRPKVEEILRYSKMVKWMTKNPIKLVGILLVVFSVLTVLADYIGIKTIISVIK